MTYYTHEKIVRQGKLAVAVVSAIWLGAADAFTVARDGVPQAAIAALP